MSFRPLPTVALYAMVSLLTTAGTALVSDRAVDQYGIRHLNHEKGLPSDSVAALAQTPDGYLWIGTETGLVRFDGVRARVFDRRTELEMKVDGISALEVDEAGTLWVGTYGGGLLRYEEGHLHLDDRGLPSDAQVSALLGVPRGLFVGTWDELVLLPEDRGPARILLEEMEISSLASIEGRTWVGTNGAGVWWIEDEEASPVPATEPLSRESVYGIEADGSGGAWIASRSGLYRWSREELIPPSKITGQPAEMVTDVVPADGGGLWIAALGRGLTRIRPDGTAETLGREEGLPSSNGVGLLRDRQGSLWMATNDSGVVQVHDTAFAPWTGAQGLSDTPKLGVIEDRRGRIWVGTFGGGIEILGPEGVSRLTAAEGLVSDFVLSLAPDPERGMWIGTRGGGIQRIREGRPDRVLSSDRGLLDDSVGALLTTSRGELWIGTTRGVNVLEPDGGLRAYREEDGLAGEFVHVLLEDGDGAVWVGTRGEGLTRIGPESEIDAFSTEDGLPSGLVLSLHRGTEGLWVGTNGGLARFESGRFSSPVTSHHGLPHEAVLRILEGLPGELWLSTNRGVARVSEDRLRAVTEGRRRSLDAVVYYQEDGLPSSEFNGGIHPAGWKARDGRLWFPTLGGIASVDPRRLRESDSDPQPRVERILGDGRPVPEGSSITPIPHRIEIEYTAIDLTDPESLEFRFRLRGLYDDWEEIGRERSAQYTGLGPGDYSFEVQARPAGGAWSETTATAGLTVPARFYQRRSFWIVMVLLVVGLAVAGHRHRVAVVQRRERRLRRLTDQLQRTESRYRDLFENASDMVLTIDPRGRLTSINRTGRELLGIEEDRVDTIDLPTLVPEPERDSLRAWVRDLDRDSQEVPSVREVPFLDAEGSELPLELGIRRIERPDGTVGFQVIGRDLRERRRAEERLRQAQKMEAVGQLAGGMAHDFNNILMIVLGQMELLREALPGDSEDLESIHEVEEAVERANRLTRQLLAFGRRQELKARIVSPDQVVGEMADLLRRVLGEHIVLTTSLSSGLRIEVDPGQLEQTILNLALNARDAMPEGGELSVTTARRHRSDLGRSSRQPDHWLEIEVRDTGEGIPEEIRERIFEPFFTTREPGSGSGMGLAVVHGFVHQSGGFLRIESEVGAGTSVRIYLPSAQGPLETEERGGSPEPKPADQEDPLTVLLVEDDDSVRSLIRRILETGGHRVVTADSGEEALKLWPSIRATIDVLVTDIMMPGTSGPDLARTIREERPDLGIVFISGHRGEGPEPDIGPGTAFLAKPFKASTLLETVRKLTREPLDDTSREEPSRPSENPSQ